MNAFNPFSSFMRAAPLFLALLAAMTGPVSRAENPVPADKPVLYRTAFEPPLPVESSSPEVHWTAAQTREATAKYAAELLKLRTRQTATANHILKLLAACRETEILRLNPDTRVAKSSNLNADRYTADGQFIGGYKITGSKIIGDNQDAVRLSDALKTGFAESDGTAADCFNPRHALRFQADHKTYVIVACFECQYAYLFELGSKENCAELLISNKPATVFEEIYSKHSLPKES